MIDLTIVSFHPLWDKTV